MTEYVLVDRSWERAPLQPSMVGAPRQGELREREGGVPLAQMNVAQLKRVVTDKGGLPRTFAPSGVHVSLLDDVPTIERHTRVEEWFKKARHPSLTRGQAEAAVQDYNQRADDWSE